MLSGELDLSNAEELESAVLRTCADGVHEIVLDVSQLEFVDSAGLRALISARGICESNGAASRSHRRPEQVQRLLRLTGLSGQLSYDAADGANAGEQASSDTQ